MPTPSKPYAVLKSEKKSHRTKAELEKRKTEEAALFTGVSLKERPETKANPTAHKEFLRLSALLGGISKNDALYESIINRYAMIQAECVEFEQKRETFYANEEQLREEYDNPKHGEMPASTYFKLINDMQKTIIDLDKQVMTKRKMLLDIEKECVMTIASAIRTIPKKVESDINDPLAEALKGG